MNHVGVRLKNGYFIKRRHNDLAADDSVSGVNGCYS